MTDIIDTTLPEVQQKSEPTPQLMPHDLYIPPDALKVFLETFEGPLDLLLYLIKKQNIDILDIPIAQITHQYIQYVDLMQKLQLELVAEYLLMAAMLAEIKSRLLLPRPPSAQNAEEEDPRAQLIRRLQEYERFKKAAEDLDLLHRVERDTFIADAVAPAMPETIVHPNIALSQVLDALRHVMTRSQWRTQHHIKQEILSVRERMTLILSAISEKDFTLFGSLIHKAEGSMGVAVSLLAVLELTRQSIIEAVQAAPFAPIYVKKR
jgi:segregation and condensation protein A